MDWAESYNNLHKARPSNRCIQIFKWQQYISHTFWETNSKHC